MRLPGEVPFVVRFLARRPHLLPAPGGLVLVLGVVERGRLLGEAVLRLPLPPSELPGAPLPASKGLEGRPLEGPKGEAPHPFPGLPGAFQAA